MDEIKLAQQKEKGAKADALLRSDVFNEAFTELRKELMDAWIITHINDDKGRERLWQAVNLLGKVREKLIKMAENGKIATKDIADLKYLKR